MPIVSKTTVWVLEQPFERIVKCNSKGVFSSNLPEPVAASLGVNEATGEDMSACLAKWNDLINTYSHTRITKSDVILYKMDDDRFSRGGVSLEVWAAPYTETVSMKPDGSAHYKYDRYNFHDFKDKYGEHFPQQISNGNSTPYRGEKAEHFITCSPDAIRLFREIEEGLHRIKDKLNSLAENDKLLAFLSSGVSFAALPAPTKED